MVASRSAAAMVMLTLCTRPCAISRLAPLDAASSDVEIVSPTVFALTTDPVVNSPAAKVMLLAPTPSVAFEIVQTTRSSEAVMVQGVESAAVPPGGGTSTPTGFDLPVKYSGGKVIVTLPPTGRPVKGMTGTGIVVVVVSGIVVGAAVAATVDGDTEEVDAVVSAESPPPPQPTKKIPARAIDRMFERANKRVEEIFTVPLITQFARQVVDECRTSDGKNSIYHCLAHPKVAAQSTYVPSPLMLSGSLSCRHATFLKPK